MADEPSHPLQVATGRTLSVDLSDNEKKVINQATDSELQHESGLRKRPSISSDTLRTVHVKESRANENGLRLEVLPLSDLNGGIVGWESQDDTAMPFNFSKWHKWTWVWLLSAITLLTPFATSILSPAINQLDTDFGNTNPTVGSMTVSIYLFGYVVGPVLAGPLSEIYGRKLVLNIANVLFCLWQIGCALAPNIETLIVSRFFSGVGGAACLTLGGSVIGDLFRPRERGFAIGMWNLGPLFGGFITEYIGWRWDFWIVLASAAPVTLLIIFGTKETCHKVLIQQKTAKIQKELGRSDLTSCYSDSVHQSTSQTLRTSLLRPLKLMALSPIVFFLSLYIAFIFGVVYLLYTTIPTVFEEKYGFNGGETGFPYISLGLGNILAWLLFTIYSDRVVIKLSLANDGVFIPEMRLPVSVPFGLVLPIALFWYGWSSYRHLQWASTIISLAPFGFGIMGLFLPISTYIVDSYPIYAASATSANVILRSLVGALLPLAGPPLYASLGLGWGNSLLGFIGIIMIPFPLIFYKFGGRLRKAQRFKL